MEQMAVYIYHIIMSSIHKLVQGEMNIEWIDCCV